MASFAQFASDLDASTQKLLGRGSRLTQLLKQPQFKPYPVEEQVVAIYAGTRGYLDAVPIDSVNRYEAALLDSIRANGADILDAIRTAEGPDAGDRGEAEGVPRPLRQVVLVSGDGIDSNTANGTTVSCQA